MSRRAVNHKPYKPFDDKEVETITKLRAKGYSSYEIAKRIGRSASSVRDKMNRGRRKITADTYEEWVKVTFFSGLED